MLVSSEFISILSTNKTSNYILNSNKYMKNSNSPTVGRAGPYLQIFLNYLLWRVSQEDVKVKDAPGCAVCDSRGRLKSDL